MANITRRDCEDIGLDEAQTTKILDKIHSIIDPLRDSLDQLRDERDKYKTEAAKIPALTKERDDALNAGKDANGKDYKQLYTDLVAQNEAAKSRAGKEAGYKNLLKTAGIAEKFWPLIIKANAADIDGLELDGDKVKGAEDITKGMKESLAPYISTTETHGTKVDNPPKGEPVKKTREEIMAIADSNERQQAIAENIELFQ